MNVNYHKRFECEVNHTYFSNGISSIFNLIPLRETSRLLNNYDILLRKQQNVFSFYSGMKEGHLFEIDKEFDGISNLYFQLIVNDVSFFNYTSFIAKTEAQLYYFSNQNTTKDLLLLHGSNFVEQQDFISFKPHKFTIVIPSGKFKLEIKTSEGDSLLKAQFSNNQKMNYSVDLSLQVDGLYEIWYNDNLQEKVFICNESRKANCIGILQFNIAALSKIYDENLRYSINFNSKKAYWRYKVVVSDTRKIKVVKMHVTGINNEDYEGPLDQTIIGGQTAQIFTSKMSIPLHEKLEKHPLLTVSYVNGFSNRTNEFEIKLPNPGIENITTNNNEEDEKMFFSSTIVYV